MSHNVRPPSAKLQHKPSAPPFPADHDDEYSEDVGNNGAVYDGHDGGHEQYYYGSDEFSGPWQPTHRPPGYYEDEAGYSRQDYVHYDGYLEDDALHSGQRGYHADQHRGTPPAIRMLSILLLLAPTPRRMLSILHLLAPTPVAATHSLHITPMGRGTDGMVVSGKSVIFHLREQGSDRRG